MKTLAWIPASKITEHLPNEETVVIDNKPLWHSKYDNY